MKKRSFLVLITFLYFIPISSCYSFQKKESLEKIELKILTWNIQDLGKTKNNEEIYFIANILKDFDIVALQEVVAKDPGGARAVAKIADALNRLGSKWDYSISNPTNSSSNYVSERYAFLWKTSKIRLEKKAFLDKELEDEIEREPYIGLFEFTQNKTSFYIVNMHARTYNNQPEMEISNFKYYPKRFETDNLIILGDFNLNEKHTVWNPLYKIGFASAIKNTPTTLKRKCKNGNYTNHSIDNIYFNTKILKLITSGVVDFVKNCSRLSNARLISDHLPVFLTIEL